MAEDMLWFLADPVIGTAIVLVVGAALGFGATTLKNYLRYLKPTNVIISKNRVMKIHNGLFPNNEITFGKNHDGTENKTTITRIHYNNPLGRPSHLILEGEPQNVDVFKKVNETQSAQAQNQLILGGIAYGENKERLLTSAPVQMNKLYIILIVFSAMAAVLSGISVAKQMGLLDF